jgi:hypothetical protein
MRARTGSILLSPLLPIAMLLLCTWGMHWIPAGERDRFELAVLGAVVMTFVFQHEQREKRDLQNILITIRMDSESWDETRRIMQNSINAHKTRIEDLERKVYIEREERLLKLENRVGTVEREAIRRGDLHLPELKK